MKKFYFPKFAIAFISVFISLVTSAQNFHLLKDINTFTDATPRNLQLPNGGSGYAALNGWVFFAANDGINGVGLWKSDGTTAGTVLLKSLVADTADVTCVRNITPCNGKIIFSLKTATINQLWLTDGTASGTKKLVDLPEDNYNDAPEYFTPVGNETYFVNSANIYNDQLWRTNGTDTGTVLITDFYKSSYGYDIEYLTNYNGAVFFSLLISNVNNGSALWKSNGTTAGTVSVYNNFSTFNYGPLVLTVTNDTLYFIAEDFQSANTRLYKTDGTTLGTKIVDNTSQFPTPYIAENIPVIKNTLLFLTQSGFYKYDTKMPSAGIQPVTDINPLADMYGVYQFTTLNDSLLFLVSYDSTRNMQLWSYDGTAAGTTLLTTSPRNTIVPDNLYGINNTLFFSCYSNNNGNELWSSDGSLTGTKLVKDISPGVYSSNPSCFTAVGNNILFTANDGTTGYELWKTDGTGSGTSLVKDINKTSTSDASPAIQTVINGKLLFGAFDNLYGNEIRETGGTSAETNIIKDILPGYLSGNNGNPHTISFKGSNYFFSNSVNDSTPLWKTDGTAAGTQIVQDFGDSALHYGNQPYVVNMAANDSLLFIQIRDNSNSEDGLWVSNGTFPAKLLMKYYLSAGSSGTTIPQMYFLGNTVIFGTEVGYNQGCELWRSDGTIAGTQMVKSITPAGRQSGFSGIVYKNKLYFGANDGTNIYLWVSDGTNAGTNVLKNVEVNTYVAFTASNGKIYFAASDSTSAQATELWVTDGTAAGTQMVKDIYQAANLLNINNMVDVNGTLFFTAYDGAHGTELWKSNGTDTGTVLVKDITTGSTSSNLSYLVNGNGKLYFINDYQLWQSNGTDSGTKAVADANLAGVTNISGLAAAGDKLYFSGYTYLYGQELYVGEANSTLPVTLLSFTGQWAKKDAQLTWVTTNELNNNHFNVQRSLTGMGFTTIGCVKATGDVTARNTYNYTDVNAANLGSNYVYYRLQQVDNDGKFVYTNIIRLDVSATNIITIAPNPAQKTANIISSNDILDAEIKITDMGGRIVYTSKQNLTAGTPTPLNISGLAAGVYNVTVQSGNNVKQQTKLVVR